jgi:hypothetical protein
MVKELTDEMLRVIARYGQQLCLTFSMLKKIGPVVWTRANGKGLL